MNPLREQVSSDKCPGCDKQFTCIINARSHWAKQICAHNGTAMRTQAQVQDIIEQQMNNAGHNGGNGQDDRRPRDSETAGPNIVRRRPGEAGIGQRIARILDDYFRTA